MADHKVAELKDRSVEANEKEFQDYASATPVVIEDSSVVDSDEVQSNEWDFHHMDLNDDRYPMRTDGQVSQEWSKMQDTQILTIQCVFPKKFAYWFKNKIDDNEIIVPKIPYLIQWRDQSSGKVTIRTF